MAEIAIVAYPPKKNSQADELYNMFTEDGHTVHPPWFDGAEPANQFMPRRLDTIRNSDYVYGIINQRGEYGNRYLIELAYAAGYGIPVILSNPPNSPWLHTIAAGIMSPPRFLATIALIGSAGQ